MSTDPLQIRLAQASAIFFSATSAGASFAISAFVVPRLLESPVPVMLRQFARTYITGRNVVGSASVVASLPYFYLSSRYGLSGLTADKGRAYLAAGLLTVAVAPYTRIFMMRVNRILLSRAEGVELVEKEAGTIEETGEAAAAEEETAWVKGEGSKYLVDRWGVLNLGRTLLLMGSAIVGLGTTI